MGKERPCQVCNCKQHYICEYIKYHLFQTDTVIQMVEKFLPYVAARKVLINDFLPGLVCGAR